MALNQVPASTRGGSFSARIPSGSSGVTYTFNNRFETGPYVVTQNQAASFALGGTTVSTTSFTLLNVSTATSSISIDTSPIASWTNSVADISSVITGNYYRPTVVNGYLYVAGTQGWARTSDGTTWSAAGSLQGVESNIGYVSSTGTYVTGAYTSPDSLGRIYSSGDGVNWTSRISGTGGAAGRPPKAIATSTGSTQKVVVTGNSGHTYWSTNGTSWSGNTQLPNLGNGCASNNTTYVIVGESSTYRTSNTGDSWGGSTIGSGIAWRWVAHGGGLFVVVGSGGNLYTSTDGSSWTQRTSGTSSALNHVSYDASATYPWMAITDGSQAIFSTNGTTWISRLTGGGSGIAYFAGKYRAIGSGGYRSAASIDGVLTSDLIVNFIGPSESKTLS
jgi:hypothetical protein